MLLPCAPLAAAIVACALGEPEDPGCQANVDCGEGFTCRAGACFRLVGEPSPPPDTSAEDAGDAAESG
jgi:hypothetical protein